MGAHALAMPRQDERRTRRVALSGDFSYEYDGEAGRASWKTISLDGACINAGRYFRPGGTLRVEFRGMELTARVVWCRPVNNGESFMTGLRVINGGPELALMTLMAVAQRLVARSAQ
jgi:hypothetical protein